MKKGKGCNLAAGIIEIVFAALFLAVGLYYIFAAVFISDVAGAFGGGASPFSGLIIYLSLIILAIGGVSLGFGISTIKITNKEPEEYYKKWVTILVYAIIETVFFALSFADFSSEASYAYAGIMLAIVVLHWVGFGLMKAGSKKAAIQKSEAADKPEIATELEEVKVKPKKASAKTVKEEPVESDSKVEQLAKLLKLKKSGAITEEEYNKLKSEILN